MGFLAHILRGPLRFEYLEREPFCYPIPPGEEPAEGIEDIGKFRKIDLRMDTVDEKNDSL